MYSELYITRSMKIGRKLTTISNTFSLRVFDMTDTEFSFRPIFIELVTQSSEYIHWIKIHL